MGVPGAENQQQRTPDHGGYAGRRASQPRVHVAVDELHRLSEGLKLQVGQFRV